MRNYFKTLHLKSEAPLEDVVQALSIGTSTGKALTPGNRTDAYDILLDEDRRKLYAGVVELYESMHIAIDCLRESVGKDTHRWQERLSEFDTAIDDHSSIQEQQGADASNK